MFTIPNITTGLNLLSGIIAIILTFCGRLELAVVFIFLGAVFDFFDGFLARLLKKQGELGKQLDSLADMITFGVAPGMIVFVLFIISGAWDISAAKGVLFSDFWQTGTFGYNISFWVQTFFNDLSGNLNPNFQTHFTGWYLYLPFVSLFIPFFSLFRLAKFNLDTRQTTSFIGLPTPANTIFFASIALLVWDGFGKEDWTSSVSMILIKDQVLMSLVVIFSVLLISEIPLFSLKFKGFGWKGNEIKYTFLLISLILITLLLVWALPIIIILYLLLSVVENNLIKKE